MKSALRGLGTQAGTGHSLESSGHNQGKDPEAGLCSCENEKKSQVSMEGSKDTTLGKRQEPAPVFLSAPDLQYNVV